MALLALFGFCLFPFLVPLRTQPIPSFYAEWLALALGLLAFPALLGRPGLVVPRIAVLPAGMIVLLLLQGFWLPAALRPGMLLALLYLLWALLLMLATAALLRDISLARLAAGLTLALVLASIINACNVILFQAGLRTGLEWLFLRTDRAGNLGQANMLADLLWLGVVAVLYRWQGSARHSWLHVIGLAPLLVASALTGARAPLLYVLWLVLAARLWGSGRLRRATICIAGFYVAVVVLVHSLPIEIMGGSDSISRILSAAGSGTNVRLNLISAASQIFLEHPWFGAGWGSFAWESYRLTDDQMGTWAVAEHAHQFFLQLAAEFGVFAILLAAGALFFWARPIWLDRIRLKENSAFWWCMSAAGILFLHSQLEYPLWYAHLLGLFVILLACTDRCSWEIAGWRRSGLLVACLLVIGAYLLVGGLRDYVRLERWVADDVRRGNRPAPEGHYQVLAELSNGSLLQAQAMRVLAAVMLPTTEQLAGKREVCRRALLSEPQSPAVFTCALLESEAGETANAEWQMRQAKRVFPEDVEPYQRRTGRSLMLLQ